MARRLKHPPLIPTLLMLVMILAAILAPWIAPHDPLHQNLMARLTPPVWTTGQWTFMLGTDALGRDILSNIIYGLQVSLLAGFVSVAIGVSIGVTVGLIAGYRRGWFDTFIMRAADVQLSLPAVLIALAALAILGRGLWIVIIVIGVVAWAQYARLVRASVLAEREKQYAMAAAAVGASPARILFRHILPNVIDPILVQISVDIPRAVELAATLSFLGLGVATTTPALGLRIAQGYQYLFSGAWWVSVLPGLALVLLVLCENMVGDWLRDAIDPRYRSNKKIKRPTGTDKVAAKT